MNFLEHFLLTFGLVFIAELGDKSQLVCMNLASRYKPTSVIAGSISAFLILNLLAVSIGTVAITWIPRQYLAWTSALLFLFFAYKSYTAEEENENIEIQKGNGFKVAFLMTFLAEFGDRTQLAVAALSSQLNPLVVYLAASSALVLSVLLAVQIGKKIFKLIPEKKRNMLSGTLFLITAGLLLIGDFIGPNN
jgi:Ca2+/H+ antiporter, TMEM165/GDT1 family